MEKTKFGYKEIDQKDKPSKVNQVFTSVSNRYDLMNAILSFGLHRLWKKQFLRLCNLSNKKNVLDVACGTGDIALAIKKQKNSINLTCLDPNKEMIEICKQKFLNSETNNNSYLVRIIGSNISLDRYYKNIKTDVVIEELIKLKGIGDYTASAIGSIAFKLPLAAIDGNVYRFYSRVFGIKKSISNSKSLKYFKEKSQELMDKKKPGDFNQALMEFGS